MNYVILDLEWDSQYSKTHRRFINHIIQIGAVKLDSKFNIVDTFQVTVKSSVSKKLSHRFTDLTGITNDDMNNGIPLINAVLKYDAWVGKNVVTLTWSTSDLYTISDNSDCFLPEGLAFKIEKYMDLQSYVQNKMREKGFEISSQISLINAATLLGISADGLDLHTAKDDCRLSVEVFKRVYDGSIKQYIKNTDKAFFDRLAYKSYYITDIRSDYIDPENLVFKCEKCGKPAKCLTGWRYRNAWFSANFRCTKCKRTFIGRVSFRKNYDSVTVRKKTFDLKAVENKDGKSVQSLPEKMPSLKNRK